MLIELTERERKFLHDAVSGELQIEEEYGDTKSEANAAYRAMLLGLKRKLHSSQ